MEPGWPPGDADEEVRHSRRAKLDVRVEVPAEQQLITVEFAGVRAPDERGRADRARLSQDGTPVRPCERPHSPRLPEPGLGERPEQPAAGFGFRDRGAGEKHPGREQHEPGTDRRRDDDGPLDLTRVRTTRMTAKATAGSQRASASRVGVVERAERRCTPTATPTPPSRGADPYRRRTLRRPGRG